MGGQSAGSAPRISNRASTPPVEAPMPTRAFEPDTPPVAVLRCTGETGSWCCIGRWMRDRPAAFTVSRRTLAASATASGSPVGLGTQSKAPRRSASMLTSAPRGVSDEHMTTGIGRTSISRARKVRPSVPGMSTSSVSTSGRSSAIAPPAVSGQEAVPTTSIPGSAVSSRRSIIRIDGLSSMTSARTGWDWKPISVRLPRGCRSSARPGGTGCDQGRRAVRSGRYRACRLA